MPRKYLKVRNKTTSFLITIFLKIRSLTTRSLKISILAISFLAATACGNLGQQQDSHETIAAMSRREARLYTAEIQMRGAVEFSSQEIIKILGSDALKYGSRTIYIPVAIPARAYIDLGLVEAGNIRISGRKVSATLPGPEIEYGPGRQDGSIIEHSGIGKSFSASERIELTKEAIGKYREMTGPEEETLKAEARRSAEKKLKSIIKGLGYRAQDIEIKFRNQIKLL